MRNRFFFKKGAILSLRRNILRSSLPKKSKTSSSPIYTCSEAMKALESDSRHRIEEATEKINDLSTALSDAHAQLVRYYIFYVHYFRQFKMLKSKQTKLLLMKETKWNEFFKTGAVMFKRRVAFFLRYSS